MTKVKIYMIVWRDHCRATEHDLDPEDVFNVTFGPILRRDDQFLYQASCISTTGEKDYYKIIREDVVKKVLVHVPEHKGEAVKKFVRWRTEK